MKLPRLQFRLSDMIIVVTIIGSFPLVVGYAVDDPNESLRTALLVFGALFECAAAIWACAILQTWKVEGFFARMAVHLYTFVAILGFILLLVLSFVMIVVISMLFNHPQMRNAKPGAEFVIALGISSGLAYSIIIVEHKRRKRAKNNLPGDTNK